MGNLPYRNRNMEKSMAAHQRAMKNMPLGVTDSYRYWGEGETIFVKNMKGGRFTDLDDNEYVDFRLCYGPIILGHSDQRVDDAVVNCIRNTGHMIGLSVETESEVVELIKKMCPNIEKMRFANSGTEAVLGAIRTARGFNKKEKVIVIEGGFHGLFDEMMWKADVENWNQSIQINPSIIPFGTGLSSSSRQLVDLIPLNSMSALDHIFNLYGEEISSVIIEPILGNCGSIEATPEYLRYLRKKCDQYGAILIMDEVKTGFRISKGGVQELYDVQADLTTYAKAMGNGYPIAAFGGRRDIMDKISFEPDGVVHGGTYTANLIGISAAKATLQILHQTQALENIADFGKKVQSVLSSVFSKFSLPHHFSGPSAMFGVHFGDSVPNNYRDWKKTDGHLYTKFAKNLIELGILIEPDSREPWFICEAHQEDVNLNQLYDKSCLAMEKALK